MRLVRYTLSMLKKIIWRVRTLLRRLLGKNARTVWISHPIFLQHQPGTNHPDKPERISAIQAALKKEGIWRHLQTAEAPEIKRCATGIGSLAQLSTRIGSCPAASRQNPPHR